MADALDRFIRDVTDIAVRTAVMAVLLLASLSGSACAANDGAAATPTQILTGIYREAVKGATSDWLEPNRRGQYLSNSLAALWAKSDARKPPDGDVGPIDFDLTTDTNALELVGFDIKPLSEAGAAASLAVNLSYKKPYVLHHPAVVTYDFTRENGRWRIDNIRTHEWSVRDLLTQWLKGP